MRSLCLNLTVDNILARAPGLSATEVNGRVVVLSLKAASYFDLNRVASEIWEMLSRPRSVKEILQQLSQHHDVDAEVLARDVTGFLQSLIVQRLVRLIPPEDVR